MLVKRRHSLLPRWDLEPRFRDMQLMLDQLFPSFFSRFPATELEPELPWRPPVDVSESDEEFLFEVDLPGMKLEDVQVTVEGDTLVVHGERKWDKEEEKERVHRRERFHGSFHREMSLPPQIDPDRIEAKFRDGVLELHMPRLEAAKPRVLKVKAA